MLKETPARTLEAIDQLTDLRLQLPHRAWNKDCEAGLRRMISAACHFACPLGDVPGRNGNGSGRRLPQAAAETLESSSVHVRDAFV